jgi:hypothetical protein
MNPKLYQRIEKLVRKEGREYKWSQKLISGILREVKDDLILPMLNLKANAKIALEYDEDGESDDITLIIGSRDFQFDHTGDCHSAGTYLG